jgi:hypothetical protein
VGQEFLPPIKAKEPVMSMYLARSFAAQEIRELRRRGVPLEMPRRRPNVDDHLIGLRSRPTLDIPVVFSPDGRRARINLEDYLPGFLARFPAEMARDCPGLFGTDPHEEPAA